MERPITRRAALGAGIALATAGIAGCTGQQPANDGGDGSTGNSQTENDPPTWSTASLTDVRSEERFTVGGFSGPVLLETFAVWCSTCLQQQREMKTLREERADSLTLITLNVDPNEDAGQVREHANRHGFDWYYAIAPPAVTQSLIDSFDQSIIVPPQAPMVLVCDDGGYRRLGDGIKSTNKLRDEVAAGC